MTSAKRSIPFLIFLSLFFNFCLFPAGNLHAQLSSENRQLGQIENRNFTDSVRDFLNKLFRHEQLEAKKKVKPAPKTFMDKLDLHYGVNEGYERNVPLDSSHKGSFFTNQNLGIGYTDHIKNTFVYRLGYNLHSQIYGKFSDHDILAQTFSVETALKLIPHYLYLETDYHDRIFRRQHTPLDDYNENEVKIGLKNYLIKDTLYQKPSYIFRHDGYDKFKARDAQGTHGLKDRMDNINAFDHEIGIHFLKHGLLRIHNQIGWADSNDQFLDFYDYSYYQVTPVLTWHLTEKCLLLTGFLFQHNNYDGRAVYGTAEKENLYSTFGGIYYNFNQYMTWKFNTTYTKSDNNVPELEFGDASFSTGLEFNF